MHHTTCITVSLYVYVNLHEYSMFYVLCSFYHINIVYRVSCIVYVYVCASIIHIHIHIHIHIYMYGSVLPILVNNISFFSTFTLPLLTFPLLPLL